MTQDPPVIRQHVVGIRSRAQLAQVKENLVRQPAGAPVLQVSNPILDQHGVMGDQGLLNRVRA